MRNRWYLIVAAILVSATIVMTGSTDADAKPGSGKGGGGGSVKGNPPGKGGGSGIGSPGKGGVGNANKNGGLAGKQNWIGKSRPSNFNGWTKHCHFPQYGCRGYYCPEDATWYYWYEPFECYLPVSYMASYPPPSGGKEGPALPPGATPVPQRTYLQEQVFFQSGTDESKRGRWRAAHLPPLPASSVLDYAVRGRRNAAGPAPGAAVSRSRFTW